MKVDKYTVANLLIMNNFCKLIISYQELDSRPTPKQTHNRLSTSYIRDTDE